MKFIEIKPNALVKLTSQRGLPELVHVFEERAIHAVNAALAAGRPLLLRGEPGVGKSQLARAVAKVLGRAFVQHVVDIQAESRDLMWHFDAIERLADAQLFGALKDSSTQVHEKLAVANYLHPGPLWWAFDWNNAKAQAHKVAMPEPPQRDGGDSKNGCVVLIDEIDKAETDMPNGLLEALGAGEFTPFGLMHPVMAQEPAPLVFITTNEERALPDAFVRRCLVLHLYLPEEESKLISLLEERGRAHFPKADPSVLTEAAKMLAEDRKIAEKKHLLPLPGQAEYLDLLRAVLNLKPNQIDEQKKVLKDIAEYTLKKHTGAS